MNCGKPRNLIFAVRIEFCAIFSLKLVKNVFFLMKKFFDYVRMYVVL